MHPNRAFDWADRAELLGFVRERAFAHIFSADADGLHVAHAPLHVTNGECVQFHLFRNNPASSHFDGRPVLLSLSDADGYHSANWYASADQVPTWHYEVVEIEGPARILDESELTGLLDQLTERMEQRFSPAAPWTRAKMGPGKFEQLLGAIVGFEVAPTALRGTRKFNQHKSRVDIEANIRGQEEAGRDDLAERIRRYWADRQAAR